MSEARNKIPDFQICGHDLYITSNEATEAQVLGHILRSSMDRLLELQLENSKLRHEEFTRRLESMRGKGFIHELITGWKSKESK